VIVEDGEEFVGKRKKRDDFMDSTIVWHRRRLWQIHGGEEHSLRCAHQVISHVQGWQYVFHDHFGDKTRVFAKCISGGRPFDMVDIMLMTQSS
jgi:hypothetical protein